MSRTYDCTDAEERATAIREAAYAVRRGELIVLPTDTVYGVGADAFSPLAVSELLRAKRRGRNTPPSVLVGTPKAATALIEDLGPDGQNLMDAFWPGALTVICRANRSLAWDLGETKGTVAVRMPDHELAIELLKQTGPLAVSSANLTGNDAAATIGEAETQLGDAVELYLDAGPVSGGEPSTIVDLTGPVPRIVRPGGISTDRLREVAATIESDDDPPDTDESDADQPDADRTDADRPDADRPDADRPDADRPERNRPDAG